MSAGAFVWLGAAAPPPCGVKLGRLNAPARAAGCANGKGIAPGAGNPPPPCVSGGGKRRNSGGGGGRKAGGGGGAGG